MAAAKQEVIDLTVTQSSDDVIILESGPSTAVATPKSSGGDESHTKKKRKRKKRKSAATSVVEDGEVIEATSRERTTEPSAIRNGEREGRRHRSRSRDGPRDTADTTFTHDDELSALFFSDVTADALPAIKPVARLHNLDAAQDPSPATETKLLLPAHVEVLPSAEGGVLPVEILPPSDDESDEDAIEYLDYDDGKAAGTVRYFDAQEAQEAKPRKFVCKKCGAEGDHKTFECPVLICLTCGARDEHSTRSCPISKTCFTCGMKGHINATCPNRNKRMTRDTGRYDECDRCGSNHHRTNECPTLWRIYEYVTDEGRTAILEAREAKRLLPLGEGGEAYIAGDEWCYNCGGCGHLGDDCRELPHPRDHPVEASAFGSYNILSGPFADPSSSPSAKGQQRREPRDWERDALPMNWGQDAPAEVGKMGRKKDRARMEKRARDAEADGEEDDWFGRLKNSDGSRRSRNENGRDRDRISGGGHRMDGASGTKKITFGASLQDRLGTSSDSGSKPGLAERLAMGRDDGRHEGRYGGNRPRSGDRRDWDTGRDRNRDRGDRGRDRDRDRDQHHGRHRGRNDAGDKDSERRRDWRDRQPTAAGPRYKGGYSR
ncbi:hypothetical protein PUNSTDRAFT_100511 [Punctularia strigosozonata HHB-11173 SS5]|uniref:uncharacterized protein n=1 Tax=Punctularia strigosozonata (strain HHB-11173) TaxID=741275 RepID=UPI0004418033|nr:uncharacterized protein PUNSTDRAFT_100511 [Punctularia strigosozonata HHB-11173 SS5]EIN10754.1 hypothetical protein PUNSTDRAFT_100511 [Punctularia strigosozonata HHB-11173 SS5]